MDRIKDCGRVADVGLIDIPCRSLEWCGPVIGFVDRGRMVGPHLLVPNGYYSKFDGDEYCSEWELPAEWRALLVLQ